MHVTARAVTDGRGRTISGGDIYGLLKTVDLTGTKIKIWKESPEKWLNGFTISQILDLSDMDRGLLKYFRMPWIFKYNQICYHLKYRGVDMNQRCSVCMLPERLRVVLTDSMEYRARGCIIHERKAGDDNESR